MKRHSVLAVAAFAAALLAGVALPSSGARAVTITNGSFEAGVPITGSPNFVTVTATDSTSITGWTVSEGSIDYIGTYWTASDGTRSLDLDGLVAGTIEQHLTGLTIGAQYLVSFDLAGNPDAGPTTKTLDVMASAGSQSFSFTVGSANHTNMGWVTESFVFTADATSTDLKFISTTTSGGTSQNPAAFGPALDNVRISETPLPASLPLMLTGLAGFGIDYLRRKRKQRAGRAAA
jgi:choice-of-anchor C domain-containing protein